MSALTGEQNKVNKAIELIKQKRRVSDYYNKVMCFKAFAMGDWVLRRAFSDKKEWMVDKMGAKPFIFFNYIY